MKTDLRWKFAKTDIAHALKKKQIHHGSVADTCDRPAPTSNVSDLKAFPAAVARFPNHRRS